MLTGGTIGKLGVALGICMYSSIVVMLIGRVAEHAFFGEEASVSAFYLCVPRDGVAGCGAAIGIKREVHRVLERRRNTGDDLACQAHWTF